MHVCVYIFTYICTPSLRVCIYIFTCMGAKFTCVSVYVYIYARRVCKWYMCLHVCKLSLYVSVYISTYIRTETTFVWVYIFIYVPPQQNKEPGTVTNWLSHVVGLTKIKDRFSNILMHVLWKRLISSKEVYKFCGKNFSSHR